MDASKKVHQCEYCSFSSNRKYNLIRHIDRNHNTNGIQQHKITNGNNVHTKYDQIKPPQHVQIHHVHPYQNVCLQQQYSDKENLLVNQIQRDDAQDLEEDINVNESQFQEFLKFCTHVNPSKQEIIVG